MLWGPIVEHGGIGGIFQEKYEKYVIFYNLLKGCPFGCDYCTQKGYTVGNVSF